MPTAKKLKLRTDGQIMANRLVAAALHLIEHNGGCRGVNLRQIAARAKCAHTNAYNYFDSLEDIFWAALIRVLELQLEYTAGKMKTPAGINAPLRTFLETQLTYGQQHPGFYRLVWLEPLTGHPSPEVLDRLNRVRMTWVRQIATQLPPTFAPADHAWAGQLIHGYFHGEVCKLIGRLAFVPKSDDDSARIVRNTLALVEMIGATRSQPKP